MLSQSVCACGRSEIGCVSCETFCDAKVVYEACKCGKCSTKNSFSYSKAPIYMICTTGISASVRSSV
jgi:hypothetical protein